MTHHKNNNDLIKQFYDVEEASLSCGGGGLLVKLFGDSPTTFKQIWENNIIKTSQTNADPDGDQPYDEGEWLAESDQMPGIREAKREEALYQQMEAPIQNHKKKQVTHHENNNDLIKQSYAVEEASLSCGGGGLLVKLFGDSPTTLKQTWENNIIKTSQTHEEHHEDRWSASLIQRNADEEAAKHEEAQWMQPRFQRNAQSEDANTQS